MKRLLALTLALCLLISLCACGGETAPAATPVPAESEAPVEETVQPEAEPSVAAGTYKYYEDKGSMGIMPWTIELGEDGSCVLTEHNSYIGDQIKPCDGWVDNGDGTFTSGAWESTDGPKPDFIDEVGRITWQLVSEGICQPINGPASVDPETAEAAIAAAAEAEAEEEEAEAEESPTPQYVAVPAEIDPDVYYIVMASDRHDEGELMTNILSPIALDGYPVCFVGLNGDMVKKTECSTSQLVSEIEQAGFDVLGGSTAVGLSFGSWDDAVEDDADIMVPDKSGCGILFENEGLVVYSIGHDHMTDAAMAESSSAEMLAVLNGDDSGRVIFIMSHVPLHVRRGDNLGGEIWTKALNTLAESHDVFVVWSHNHTGETEADIDNYMKLSGGSIEAQSSEKEVGKDMVINFNYMNAGYINGGDKTVRTNYVSLICVGSKQVHVNGRGLEGASTNDYATNVVIDRMFPAESGHLG